MAIYRLLQCSAFQPDDIKRMADAYERALILLHLENRRDDPLTETVAQYIIEIAQTGEKDSGTICATTLKRLRRVEAAQVHRRRRKDSCRRTEEAEPA